MSSSISFPITGAAISCLMGTINVPYKSTSSTAIKSVNINVPVSFNFKFTNYQAQGQNITIIMNLPTSANIYKNGNFYQTKTITKQYSLFYKTYALANISTQSVCEINDYVDNFSLQFFPPQNNTFGTTDVYTFYLSMSYNITSSVFQLYYVTGTLVRGFVFNTTQSSPLLTNFTYNGGSANTGYSSYYLNQNLTSTNSWDGSVNNAYYPTTSYSDWTGLYQLQGLYSRELWISDKSINFKNQLILNTEVPQVQSINWYSRDPTSNLIGKIETDKTASSMTFYVNSSEIARGFNFSGGNINSRAQQQTWFISTNNVGNSYTPAGKILGSSDNSTSSRWDKVTTYGGAQYYASNWNTTTATFTASESGTYYFQLFIFNNGTSTSGRWLRAGGSCVVGSPAIQYLSFNQSYLTSNSGSTTISLMYYMGATQTIYFYCEDQSPLLFYSDGYTNLQIIKML